MSSVADREVVQAAVVLVGLFASGCNLYRYRKARDDVIHYSDGGPDESVMNSNLETDAQQLSYSVLQ